MANKLILVFVMLFVFGLTEADTFDYLKYEEVCTCPNTDNYMTEDYSSGDSWELGTNDSIPKTEVIVNPYSDEVEED
jgi:hypothetical protein